MPSELKRFQRAESLHFVTFSCFHRLPLLDVAGAKETVEAVLEGVRARHQARVYSYVLMPEHIHLLVNEPPRILLDQFLKAFKQITSRRLRGEREKFWQDRYYDSNVYGRKARSEVIRYIHRNPVKRGLVEKPEDWAWSSFRHYATGMQGAVEIESSWTAFRRGNQLPEGVRVSYVEPGNSPARSSQKAR
ncbi:MAG TPA: transposase [Terracidiphilus sp.]|jgi:putative transposase